MKAGPTVLVVWSSWSPRCREIVPRVNEIVRNWSDRSRVVTVDFQEDRETVREFLEGKTLRAPVFLDLEGTFSKKHRVTTLPGLVVYREGSAVYQGKLPDDPSDVLSEALGGD